MSERVVSVRFQAKVEGFTAGMRKAKASVDDLTKADVPKAAKAYGDLANKAALAGSAIALGLGVAVKRFADFDKAMSAVKANSGATGKELESLRGAALKLGADSQFSATEAAQGINELAKAGVDSQAILSGGLKGALDLAAAGQIEVGQAAETAASLMTQFNLKGSDATHVADLLTNGANKAQGGVLDLGQAMQQAGLVAAGMGLSVDETTAGLTAFAAAGLVGSDAGTSFKTMLQRLSAPSDEAKALMKQLGINAYDASGQFVGLANVAGQLQKAFEGKTDAERQSALATIFGSDAIRAANVLYNEGAQGIQKWTTEVSEQGAAAKQAAELTDNLRGDLERLGGALDTAFIQTGSSANGGLRSLVQGITGLVDAVGKVPGPVLLATGGLAALALTLPKGVRLYREYQSGVEALGLGLDKISSKSPRAGRALGIAAKGAKAFGVAAAAAAAAGGILSQFFDANDFGVEQLTGKLETSTDAVAVLNNELASMAEGAPLYAKDLDNLGSVLDTVFNPDWNQNGVNAASDFLSKISLGMVDLETKSDVAAKRLAGFDQVLAGMVSNGNADEATRVLRQISESTGISVEELTKKLPGYREAVAQVGNAARNAAGDTSVLTDATEDAQTIADKAKEAFDNLKAAIAGLGSPVAQQRQAARDYQEAIDAATASIKENGKTLDDNTDKGRANGEALDKIQAATLAKVNADFEATKATKGVDEATKVATKTMADGRKAFVDAAQAAGMTKKEAENLATQLGLVPKDVAIKVQQSGAAEAEAAIDQAARDRVVTITVRQRIADFKAQQENAANAYPRKAQGGAIFGPGTATSDSIPTLLSNNEHVWTAAEVAKLGGHGAMYALRRAVQAGWRPQGFASGGAVQYAPRVQVVTVPAASGVATRSEVNDHRLMPGVMNVYTQDAKSFQREQRQDAWARTTKGRR